jgi:hypothetical protein
MNVFVYNCFCLLLFFLFLFSRLVINWRIACWCESRAAALVLKAHKEAVNSLSGNGHAKLGTVAASVAAANATAQEAMKDVQASFRPSVIAVPQTSIPAANAGIDNSTILKVT